MRAAIGEPPRVAVVGSAACVLTAAVSNASQFGPGRTGPTRRLAVAMVVTATFCFFANWHPIWRRKHGRGLGRDARLLHSPRAGAGTDNVVGSGRGTGCRSPSCKRRVCLVAPAYPSATIPTAVAVEVAG